MKSADERRLYVRQIVLTNPDIMVDDLVGLTKATRGTIMHDLWLLRSVDKRIRKLRRRKVVIS